MSSGRSGRHQPPAISGGGDKLRCLNSISNYYFHVSHSKRTIDKQKLNITQLEIQHDK